MLAHSVRVRTSSWRKSRPQLRTGGQSPEDEDEDEEDNFELQNNQSSKDVHWIWRLFFQGGWVIIGQG